MTTQRDERGRPPMTPYWVGVASREHVAIGVAGGFCQLNHGKSAGLGRMRPGDWIVFYSPKTTYPSGDACQMFTACGEIADRDPYDTPMPNGETFSRRDVRWASSVPAAIRPLLDSLEFVEDRRHWGAKFRYGHFEISRTDFDVIRNAMTSSQARHRQSSSVTG